MANVGIDNPSGSQGNRATCVPGGDSQSDYCLSDYCLASSLSRSYIPPSFAMQHTSTLTADGPARARAREGGGGYPEATVTDPAFTTGRSHTTGDGVDTGATLSPRGFRLAEEVNQAVSDHLPGSELSQLASKPTDTPIPLSPLLYAMLDHARRLAKATDGAFDPTLGRLTKLWRATRDHGRLPDAASLRSARASVGWRHFTLGPKSRSITLHRNNMACDLGGLAKGYAAALMLESLAPAGISCTMIAAGGDIRLGDPLATAACVLGPDGCDALRKLPGVREVKPRSLQDCSPGRHSHN